MTGTGWAFVAFSTAFIIVPVSHFIILIVQRTFFTGNFSRPITAMSATISFNLVPLINKLNLQDAVIRILGEDGAYLAYPRSLWNTVFHPVRSGKSLFFQWAISRWIKKGATIEYLFLNLTDVQEARLKIIRKQLGERFVVKRLGMVAEEDQDAIRDIVERFSTLHPTLIETKDGPAFWVEYHHPKESTVAYGTKFVSPQAMAIRSEETEFKVYKHQFSILQPYEELLAA